MARMRKQKSDGVGKEEWLMWIFLCSAHVSSHLYENSSLSNEQFYNQKTPTSPHLASWSFQPTLQRMKERYDLWSLHVNGWL